MSTTLQPVQSFPPVASADAKVLVLGSMPGVASLNAYQYYAHPRNAFWPITIATLCQCSVNDIVLDDWPYEKRLELATENGIALWDVLAQCVRPGSLDSAIVANSVRVNPIMDFIQEHSALKRVIFNGKAASKAFDKHCQSGSLTAIGDNCIELTTLPSTSPAMARLSLTQKYQQWQPALSD